jgi:hypothetical protein
LLRGQQSGQIGLLSRSGLKHHNDSFDLERRIGFALFILRSSAGMQIAGDYKSPAFIDLPRYARPHAIALRKCLPGSCNYECSEQQGNPPGTHAPGRLQDSIVNASMPSLRMDMYHDALRFKRLCISAPAKPEGKETE